MFAMMGFCLPRSEEEESPGSERRSGGSQRPPVLEGTRRSTSSCRERDGHKYVSASSDEEGKEQQDATTANAADAASSCTRRRRPRRHDITVPSESSSKESERRMSMADDYGGGCFVGSVETASTAASTVGGASSFASASTSASSTAGGIGVRIAASSSSSSSACRPLPHLPMRRSERGDEKDDDDDDDSSWPRSLPSFAELTADEAEDRIRSMIRQEGEDDGYRTSDYFSTLERRRMTTARRKVKKIAKQQRREGTEEAAETSTSTATTGEEPLPVDVECRTKMISWCYQVVDHCHMSRETVSIAASYLDRYLLAPSGLEALLDRRTFQLSAMTSLYVALKLFEDVNVEPGVMVGLSRGAYVEEEFVEMELDILMALRWKAHPPTAVGFMGHFLNLFPARTSRREGRRRHSHSHSHSRHRHRSQDEDEDEDENLLAELYDCAKYQAELSVLDPSFLGATQSAIALASLLNAIETILPQECHRRRGPPCHGDDARDRTTDLLRADLTLRIMPFLRGIESVAGGTTMRSPEVFRAKERLSVLSMRGCPQRRRRHDHQMAYAHSFEDDGGGSVPHDREEGGLDKSRESVPEAMGELSPRCASFGM